MRGKLVGLFAVVLLALVGLLGRITYINATSGKKYKKQVLTQAQQKYQSSTLPAKRGDIYDRNGNILATSQKVYSVILDCKTVNSDEKYVEPTVRALTDVLGLDEDKIRSILSAEDTKNSQYQILKKQLSMDEKKAFEDYESPAEDSELSDAQKAERANIKGVWFEEDYLRSYPFNELANDAIGFTLSRDTADVGLESYYNSTLMGTDGRQYGYINDNADVEQTIIDPKDGQSIVTTLDVGVQQIVEKYVNGFKEAMGAKNIGVIAMKPSTGEIVAMDGGDRYDLNDPRDLSSIYSEDQIAAMNDEDTVTALNAMWNNFCVTETYEPGSVVKPIVMAGALEKGKISENDTFVCDGGQTFGANGDTYIKCAVWPDAHGTEALRDVIANSCNDAMMQIGMKMQITPFLKYQRLFNFGSRTGIDLPNESTGVLYDRDSMHEVELATNTFGQTFTSTMIQEYAAFNAVVNGGYYYEPHMVKQILDDNSGVVKNINPVLLRQPVSTKNADFVLSAMEQTVLDGTGKKARVPGYRVAGKTGTAEKINPETGTRWEGKYLVSFIGCAPVDDPQLTVYVVVDEPNVENQETGGYSMIISRKIMMEVLPYLNIPQTEEITDELLQELELTREDVENGRNAALIKEKSETTETDEYGNVISSGTTAETDEYGNVISSGTTAETDEYGNVISSGTTSGSTSSATGTTDAQTSQTDAYGNVISGSDSTTQGTTDDEGSAFNSNIPAPLQSQDSGDGVSTQDWITNEKLGIDENNNSY